MRNSESPTSAKMAGRFTLPQKAAAVLVLSSLLLFTGIALQPATAAPSATLFGSPSSAPMLEEGYVWTGTVTYSERSQENEGPDGENGRTHSSSMSNEYQATVQVDTLKGSKAQVTAGMTISTHDRSVDRIGCGRGWLQEPDWREMRSESSDDLNASAGGSVDAEVTVWLEGDAYTLSASFPELENGTVSIRSRSSSTGGCGKPDPPTDETVTGPWDSYGRELSVEGTLDPQNPDTISGQQQLNEYTSVSWNLTRSPNPCAEIERQIEEKNQQLDELRDAIGPKMGVLSSMSAGAIAEVAGAAPEMVGTAAGPLTEIPAALESADGGESSDYFESLKGALEGPIVTGGEGSLIALTQMAPLPQLQGFLSTLQDIRQSAYQAYGELALLRQLQSQLEQCQKEQGQ